LESDAGDDDSDDDGDDAHDDDVMCTAVPLLPEPQSMLNHYMYYNSNNANR
jgi:hypothetical protein